MSSKPHFARKSRPTPSFHTSKSAIKFWRERVLPCTGAPVSIFYVQGVHLGPPKVLATFGEKERPKIRATLFDTKWQKQAICVGRDAGSREKRILAAKPEMFRFAQHDSGLMRQQQRHSKTTGGLSALRNSSVHRDYLEKSPFFLRGYLIAACAAARRAIGTR